MEQERGLGLKRLYLIDWLKAYSFWAICIYHSYSVIFFDEFDPTVFAGTAYAVLLPTARLISFSGFTILALFSFLSGFRDKAFQLKSLLVLFTAGVILLSITQGERPFMDVIIEWDIYHFLFIALGSLIWIRRSQKRAYIFGLLGFVMTWIPLWSLAGRLPIPEFFDIALFGLSTEGSCPGWFLLPWIGLTWAALGFGIWCRRTPGWILGEKIFWPVVLLGSLPFWGAFFNTPISPDFTCYQFRLNPGIFWAHLIWVFFILRLACFEFVHAFFLRYPWTQLASKLALTRHFGIAYFLHFFVLATGALNREYLQANLWAFDVFWLSLFPLTELMTRAAVSVFGRRSRKLT